MQRKFIFMEFFWEFHNADAMYSAHRFRSILHHAIICYSKLECSSRGTELFNTISKNRNKFLE